MQKNILISYALALVLTTPAIAEPKIFTLDKGHAHIGWDIYHMGYSRTAGRFNDFDGTFNIDEEDFENSTITFTINADSVDSNHVGRDNHLRAKDYLDAATHPTIDFESTKIIMLTPTTGKLTGNLTLRGVTAPIELNFEMTRDATYPSFLPNYDELRALGFEASGEILRLDHGMDFIAFLGSPTGLSVMLDLRFDLVDCNGAKDTNIPCNWGRVEGFKGPSE